MEEISRRDFLATVPMVAGIMLVGSRLHAQGAEPVARSTPRIALEPFDYRGVTLHDSRWKTQYLAARDFYLNVPDDDILKGYRVAAGLPAPGETLGGWCKVNTNELFGQWLSGMARMYRARRRPVLELNSKVGAAALAALGASVIGLAALAVTGRWATLIGPLCYLLVFGWLSGLALGQLYKIIPFLTWLERYGPRLGKTTVPRVQDLVKERRAVGWFILYFLAVAAGTISGGFGLISLWRAAICLHLVASGFIARELWRARRLRYVAPETPARPFPAPPALPRSPSLSP